MLSKTIPSQLFFLILLSLELTKPVFAENNSINVPAVFLKNIGQFENGSRYCLRSEKSNTFFFDNYLVHQFFTVPNDKDSLNQSILNMRIDFANSNPHQFFEEGSQLNGKFNFFYGKDASKWRTDISSFGELSYRNLYPNIDLVYHNSQSGIKSDLIVHANGDISNIELKYSGIKGMSVNRQGTLEIFTSIGTFSDHIPEAYQIIEGKKTKVEVFFVIKNGNSVGFKVKAYNNKYDLVIDPQLVYCSYMGGSGDESWPTRILRDKHQNIYFAGRTTSSNFPVTPGSFENKFSGDYDVFVVKLNPTGDKILFSTFLGSPGLDLVTVIKLTGPSDDILLLGLAGANGFPTTAGAYQTLHGGLEDLFILKLNNSGNSLIFSTLVGGSTDEEASGIQIDNAGDIYVLGYAGYYFPTTKGAYQENLVGDYDVCVFKLKSDGSKLLYSTFIGGPERDRSAGLALDAQNNVYFSAWVMGNFPTTPGAYDNSFNGNIDIAVTKLDPTLSTLIFSTLIGGPGDDRSVSDVILDPDNNIIITGKAGDGFPTTPGSYSPTFKGGDSDAFVLKLNSSGTNLLYSSFLGSPGSDYARDLSMDKQGNLLITGSCQNGFPITTCPYDNTYNGGASDCFISKFDIQNSSLIYSTYLGTSGIDCGESITSSGDTIILAGQSNSSGMPVTSNAFEQNFRGGENDIFLVKLLISQGIKPTAKFSNLSYCCKEQPLLFTNNSVSGTSFEWLFGDGTQSTLESPSHTYALPGTYRVKLKASNSCSSDTISTLLKVNGYSITKATSICDGDSILLNGTYQKFSGIYTYKKSDVSGCDSTIQTILTVNPVYTNTNAILICEGETISVGKHVYSVTGIYQDKFSSNLHCDSIVNTNLTVQENPKPWLGNDTVICPRDFINLSPGNSFSRYEWSDGSIAEKLMIQKPGIYSVKVFKGTCSGSDTIFINGCGSELWFPNVFSPNRDGYNDMFRPLSQGIILSYKITIFNRWGQQLYESSDPEPGWDGKVNGTDCPEGVYYFVSSYSLGTSQVQLRQYEKRGAITLLR